MKDDEPQVAYPSGGPAVAVDYCFDGDVISDHPKADEVFKKRYPSLVKCQLHPKLQSPREGLKNLIAQRFGRLVVVSRAPSDFPKDAK
jgi:hypothetical protein